jgi:leucyl aminopeptidase
VGQLVDRSPPPVSFNGFVADTPWAHLDIAGKAWSDKSTPTVPKGGTGYGVRLLNRLVDDWQPVTRDDS